MKAKDLKIGNYVDIDGITQYIIGIQSHNGLNDEMDVFETVRTNLRPQQSSKDPLIFAQNCKGIPINQYNLQNFGFYHIGSADGECLMLECGDYTIDYIDYKGEKTLVLYSPVLNKNNSEIVDFYNPTYLKNINYVHELQNFYYSFTGKELKVISQVTESLN